MKTLLAFLLLSFFSFFVGFFSGYKWNETHYNLAKSKLLSLTENELDDYLKLKSLEEKYKKADEIFGKALMIFLADLGLRISDDKVAFAKLAIATLAQEAQNPVTDSAEVAAPVKQPIQLPMAPQVAAIDKPKTPRGIPKNDSEQTQSKESQLAGGGLGGKVHYAGVSPKPEFIRMSADPVCAKESADKPVRKEDLIIGKDNGIKNALIYVKEGTRDLPAFPSPTTAVELDQRGCSYIPHVLGIRVGQKLRISNSDPVLHNVHAMPKINPGFNMGMATVGQIIEKQFLKPELPVKIKCDVHGWMNAYIGVFDHPYFAVTQADGNFLITALPPGQYTIEAWHEKLGTRSQSITIEEGQRLTKLDFTY